MDHGLEHRAPHPRRPPPDRAATSSLPAARHQRPALHPRRRTPRPHEVLLCVQTGKTLADPNRFQFDAQRLLPQERRPRCARCGRELPEACDNTLLIAERVRRLVHRGPRPDAAVPGPRGRDRGVLAGQGGRARACTGGSRAASPDAHRKQADVRARRHLPDGLPRLLPRRRRPRPHAHEQRHPRRSRPRVGRRLAGRLRPRHHRARPDQARPALRALPQPRAHLDARHRHGLRRAPARRHDPLRHRDATARTGSRRSSPTARSRRRPRSRTRRGCCSATRYAVARPDHQGDAAVGHGQGHPARRDLRPGAQALRRGRRSSARSTSPSPRSTRSSTPPAGWRASSGSGASTRPA